MFHIWLVVRSEKKTYILEQITCFHTRSIGCVYATFFDSVFICWYTRKNHVSLCTHIIHIHTYIMGVEEMTVYSDTKTK